MTRRLIALTAAYAVVLQAVLAGFAVLPAPAHPSAGLSELCLSAGHGQAPDAPPSGTDCAACPALCGGAGPHGIAPTASAVAKLRLSSFSVIRGVTVAAVRSAERRLPPSRAPPAG